jgi:hypothetical protein
MSTRHRPRNRRFRSSRRPHTLRPALFHLLVAALTTVVAVGGFQQGHAAYAPQAVDRAPAEPLPSPSASSVNRSLPTVTEGPDYSFMAKVNSQPIHWGCSQPIRVTLVGNAPQGTQAALTAVTADLQRASRLPLQVTAPPPTHTLTASTIAVYYSPNGSSIGYLTLDSKDELGVGGPSWNSDGIIEAGAVLIRNDISATDPNSSEGRHILMHELAHALGLSHSAKDAPEVMAPETGAADRPILGPGDEVALRRIGCSP